MGQIFSRREQILIMLVLLAMALVVIGQMPVSLWLLAILLSWTLLILALTDCKTLLLPDVLTLPLLWLGLLAVAAGALPGLKPEQAIYGAAGGYGALWLLSRGYWLLRNKEGLGLGDAKLLAALGAWTGPERLPWIVLVATLIAIAALFAAWLMNGHPLDTPFPFGPALAFAGWAVFLWQYG
ncbi:prepilin peptidase [Erwinia phyllosphaerae]|uniref:prepilin peptidase n=1 Tax=Erwinia phyllosphaerae TaxID=2853256 RepID=UPI001FEE86DC|nr:A24 family peptidase [Erwinia phyllosphaerae]MBV4365730.1 A24 family peptidase [Erwinia phyllosphaerae]